MKLLVLIFCLLWAAPAHALDCTQLAHLPEHGFCVVPQTGLGIEIPVLAEGGKSNVVARFTAPRNAAEQAWNLEASKTLGYENLINDEAWSGANLSLIYSSPTLLSGLLNTAYSAPNLRLNWNAKAVNLHVPSGAPLAISEMLKPEALEPLAALCMAQAEAGSVFKEHEQELVKGRLLAVQSWSLSKDGAQILLPPFSLGGAAQLLYGCRFSAAQLMPYVQQTFELWQ